MIDLRGGAVINDGSVEPPDVHRHSVPLDAPHMGRPTGRISMFNVAAEKPSG